MNTKFFLAVFVASAVAFLGGWLIFGIILMDYYGANTNEAAKVLMKDSMNIWAIGVANIAWSLLITWVLKKTGSTSLISGFMIGAWVSFLIILTFDLSMYAFWDIYEINFLLVDIIISTLFWGIVGGVSGAVLGSGAKVAVTA